MKPRLLQKELLWKGNYLQVFKYNLLNSTGRPYTWEVVKRVGTNGIVAVVPFTTTGEVILVKQYRPPVQAYVIEFPAGLNDRNESLEEVARRELLEETGYRADSLELLISGPLSSGASAEILTVFVARDVKLVGKQNLEDAEEIEVLKLPCEGFTEHFLNLQTEDTLLDLKIPGLFEIARQKVSK